MSLFVNTNVVSLNAQRNLNTSTSSLSKSLERLSSGLRINRAGDDAAGLAISEGLRSQIRGLNQAVRNAQDGISLIATAEGAINENVNILQRIRELAVQSSNDINSGANRASLQDEVDQLVQELDRISSTVQFNGKNLLDGSFSNQVLQVGANQGQTISFSIDDLGADSIGATASVTGTAVTAALTAGDLLLNNVDVGATSSDGVSTTADTASAIAVANAINAVSGQSGVSATANATTRAGTAAVTAGTLDGTNNITINGTTFGAAGNTIAVTANDGTSALRDAINASSNSTGVTATLNGSNQIELTAADGRNIEIAASTAAAATTTGLAAGVTSGTVTLSSNDAINVGGASVADAGLTAGGVAVNNNTAVNSIDITSQSGAQSAIQTIDAAISQVSESRGELGALTNRLESTISNLRTISENLSASESRIRDTDFAQETASLTRAQILQQAGTSILAQANVTSQAALALLG